MSTRVHNRIIILALLLFSFLLPTENCLNLSLTSINGTFTISQLIGFGLFPLIAFIGFKYLSDVQRRLNLMLFFAIFINICVDFWRGGVSTIGVSITLLQLYLMCFALTSYFSEHPFLFCHVIESYGLGLLIMFILNLLGIGSNEISLISNRPYVMGEDPNNFAGGAVLVFSYYIYCFIIDFGFKKHAKDLFWILICVFMVFCSGSRGGMSAMAAIFIISIVFFLKQQKIFTLFLLASSMVLFVGIYLYYFVPEWYLERWQRTIASGDLSGRDYIWLTYYNMIMERPILGWGLTGAVSEAGRRTGFSIVAGQFGRSAHNLYLTILSSVGITGLSIFSVWIITVVKRVNKRFGDRGYILFWLMLLAIIIINFSVSWERYKILWIVTAYLMAMASPSKSSFAWKPGVIPVRGRDEKLD